jgi:hypothetical protein
MAQDSGPLEGEDGGEPPPSARYRRMPNRIDPAMDWTQVPPTQPLPDGTVSKAQSTQLPDRDDPVLTSGELSDRPLPSTSPPPSVTFGLHWSPKVAFGGGAPPALG